MCGIAGILGNIKEKNLFQAKKMLLSISHRGPDKFRILDTKNALLLFARLKLYDDFNDRSMQPMISSDRNISYYSMGKYNFKKLKNKLE